MTDRPSIRAALASGILLAALPAGLLAAPSAACAQAAADQGIKLLRISIVGNHRVPTADIRRALPVHAGETVSKADLLAGMNAIVDVYRKANVGASFKARMTAPHPGEAAVTYLIQEQAAPAAQAAAVLRLDKVTFEGNKKVASDAIASVLTLKPGEVVSDAAVSANRDAILALYKKKNVGAQITPEATYPQPNHVVLDYRIEEKAAK